MRTWNHAIRILALLGAAWLLTALVLAAPQDIRLDDRELQVPPEWIKIDVQWKPGWEETLAANPMQAWQQKLREDKAMAGMADSIAVLRRIELLKAMIGHFPAERARHIKAYAEIAQMYQQIGQDSMRSQWGRKLVHDFPDDKEAVTQGYQLMLAWNFGQYTHWGWFGYMVRPECHDWEFAVREVIALHQAGKLPLDNPAVATAYGDQAWLSHDFSDYGTFYTIFQMRRTTPAFAKQAEALLNSFGHNNDFSPYVHAAGESPAGDTTGASVAARDDSDLEFQWEAAKHGSVFGSETESIRVDRIQTLLDQAVRSDAYVLEKNQYVPLWSLIDQHLTAIPPQRLAPLVEAQQKAGQQVVAALRAPSNKTELIQAFRRYPFATCLQEVMIDQAEEDISRGHFDAAIRVQRDVLRHTTDSRLRLEAIAGLWLALSQSGDSEAELQKTMSTVPDVTQMPWRGGFVSAGELKRDLLRRPSPVESKQNRRFADLPRRRIVLPRDRPARQCNADGPCADMGFHAPWPVSQVESLGDALLVSGPTAVARYNGDDAKLAWVCALPDHAMSTPWYDAGGPRYVVANSWASSADIRRPVRVAVVSSLRGINTIARLITETFPPQLAGLEIATGKIRWSSRNEPGWKGLAPISQPLVSGDRVYVLAGPAEPDRAAALGAGQADNPTFLHVVCVSLADGQLNWKSRLGWMEGTVLDLARGAPALTLREGRIYCSTNMGLVAQLDARDGRLEWLQPYPFAIHQAAGVNSINPRREGAGPLLVRSPADSAGDLLVVAPRDHTGILAMRRDTGKLVWETPLVPSDKLVGVSGKVLVGINEHWLTALDLATGRQLYCRSLPDGTGSQAALLSGDVVVISGGKLLRIEAETGRTLEERDLKSAAETEFALLPDATIVEFAPPPLAPPKGPAPTGRPLGLPLKKIWSVPCESPQVVFRKGIGADGRSFGVVSGRSVGYVRSTPNWEMVWEKTLPVRPQSAGLCGERLLLGELWKLASYDTATGNRQWSQEMPLLPYTIDGDAGLVCVGGRGQYAAYAAVDPAAGRLTWSRSPSLDYRFGSGPATLQFQRKPDGTAELRVLGNLQLPDSGGRFGDMLLDPASGQVGAVRPLLPAGVGPWGAPTCDADGIGFMVVNWPKGHVDAYRYSDGTNLAAAWNKTLDLTPHRWHPKWIGVHCRSGVVYARLVGQLVRFDPANRQETLFDLTRPGDFIQPFILDFQERGDKLIVVSGWSQQHPTPQGKHSPEATPEDKWRVYVDVFDRATGRSLGRQELPDVLGCISLIAYETVAGYDTQVKFLDDSIVISDINGVHVFASAQ